jgi:hypothetical protein
MYCFMVPGNRTANPYKASSCMGVTAGRKGFILKISTDV